MVYRCTRVRLISQPDWRGKVITACESLLMNREVSVVDSSLPGLIQRLAEQHRLPLVDNVFLEENEGQFEVVYLTTVNEQGLEPSQEELRKWKDGRIPLCFYKYSFVVEKISKLPITQEELRECPQKEVASAS